MPYVTSRMPDSMRPDPTYHPSHDWRIRLNGGQPQPRSAQRIRVAVTSTDVKQWQADARRASR